MNRICLLPGALALLLAACNSGQPMSTGDFDPLVAPGSGRKSVNVVDHGYKAGSFVKTTMDNTAFFNKRPRGNADADKMLKGNTDMKVISDDGSYVKVELNSGEVGYVPSVMVTDPNAIAAPAAGPGSMIPVGSPGEYQVYPPLPGGGAALPPVDTSVPTIPSQIDPEAPAPAPESIPPLPGDGVTPAPPELPPSSPEKKPGE